MTRNSKEQLTTISVPPTATIRQVMHAIDRGALGTALLVDPETRRLMGLVTDGDIRRALLYGHGLESPAREFARPDPVTATLDMSSEEISAQFSDPVRIIPILDGAKRVVDLAIYDRRMRLPVAEPWLDERELRYVTECVLTGWVSSSGKFVTQFEEMFAAFCGSKFAVATSNGTSALHLALLALDIGPGDEVIVPSLTFIATANAVTYSGAKAVFVDSDLKTWNIDPEQIEAAITPRTKAIIPVHLYGHPADMDPIIDIAKRHSLAVIEDAAEAHGARYKGKSVGGLGQAGVFSFYGNKIVTTGEGGMLITNQDGIAEKARVLRDHGMMPDKRYWHSVLGYNYRMTNLQAALGVAQMEKIDEILTIKRQIAATYTDCLKDIPGLRLPPNAEWADNVYWLYSILIEPEAYGRNRDELVKHLVTEDIETRPFFPPIHLQPIYKINQTLPVAEHLSEIGLSLPSAVSLKTDDIVRITNVIREKAHIV